ncbi:MAG TPA: LysR family transcriptional regulator [Ideonella sp.]|uniref:LysR family transcriptional regulator n=1 Tax=Ideonella sp. TaxID=1929293 RepID=UPI002C8FDAD0|nr:LysR family transcriptional regulator [Ideonella sp.]HSI50663.1 LysR family transcriptional regulator [Ideonella sp.]
MDLNFRQIRAFVSVAQLGSFTRAATALHLSQPALTVQIRKLEDALQSRLLDRNSRSVALTRTGRELLPLLQRMLQDMDAVVADTREASAGRRGTVRIAALPSFAASLLPDVILACRAAQPGIAFVVRDAVASQVMQLVRDEQVDLGLTGGAVDAAEFDTLHQWADRLCLVCPADHPLAARRQLRLTHFADQPLVLTDPSTSVRALVDAAFRQLGRQAIVACETTYMMTAVAMVRAGLGLTLLPGAARELRAEPGLVARPIADAAFVRTVSLIKRRGRTLPAAGQDFLAASIAATRKA